MKFTSTSLALLWIENGVMTVGPVALLLVEDSVKLVHIVPISKLMRSYLRFKVSIYMIK
jgi:hypothetical protein